jgi:hypothetical protein
VPFLQRFRRRRRRHQLLSVVATSDRRRVVQLKERMFQSPLSAPHSLNITHLRVMPRISGSVCRKRRATAVGVFSGRPYKRSKTANDDVRPTTPDSQFEGIVESGTLTALAMKPEAALFFASDRPFIATAPLVNCMHVRICRTIVGMRCGDGWRRLQRCHVKRALSSPGGGSSVHAVVRDFAGRPSHTLPLVVKRVDMASPYAEAAAYNEAKALATLSACVHLNVLLGVNRVCSVRSDGTNERPRWLELLIDSGGRPLYGEGMKRMRLHCYAEAVPEAVAFLSIVAQILATVHGVHHYTDRRHNDLHLENVLIERWSKAMPSSKRLRYVFQPSDTGDTAPLCFQKQGRRLQNASRSPSPLQPTTGGGGGGGGGGGASCSASVLTVPLPMFFVTLIDWDLSTTHDSYLNLTRLGVEPDLYDFRSNYARISSPDMVAAAFSTATPPADYGPWWRKAHCVGAWLYATLTPKRAFDHVGFSKSLFYIRFVRLDSRLRDLLHSILDMALHRNIERAKARVVSDCSRSIDRWLRLCIGRLAMAWLDTDGPLDDAAFQDALADIFDTHLIETFFGKDSRLPYYKTDGRHHRHVSERESNAYTVVMRKRTGAFDTELAQYISAAS